MALTLWPCHLLPYQSIWSRRKNFSRVILLNILWISVEPEDFKFFVNSKRITMRICWRPHSNICETLLNWAVTWLSEELICKILFYCNKFNIFQMIHTLCHMSQRQLTARYIFWRSATLRHRVFFSNEFHIFILLLLQKERSLREGWQMAKYLLSNF